jgi:hypothetical protein
MEWHSLEVDRLSDAEELLDRLETAGAEEIELLLSRGRFVVRWRN